MQVIKKFFDSQRKHFAEGSKLETLYPFYEAMDFIRLMEYSGGYGLSEWIEDLAASPEVICMHPACGIDSVPFIAIAPIRAHQFTPLLNTLFTHTVGTDVIHPEHP